MSGTRKVRDFFDGIWTVFYGCVSQTEANPRNGCRDDQRTLLTSSAALKANAESALCGYMVWIALADFSINAIWSKSFADPVAALALIPLILREGWEASN